MNALIINIFLKNHNFPFLFYFSLIFILKLYESFRDYEILVMSNFLTVEICNSRRESNIYFMPLGSGSVNPHIFADLDPESRNIANSTDPDLAHCFHVDV